MAGIRLEDILSGGLPGMGGPMGGAGTPPFIPGKGQGPQQGPQNPLLRILTHPLFLQALQAATPAIVGGIGGAEAGYGALQGMNQVQQMRRQQMQDEEERAYRKSQLEQENRRIGLQERHYDMLQGQQGTAAFDKASDNVKAMVTGKKVTPDRARKIAQGQAKSMGLSPERAAQLEEMAVAMVGEPTPGTLVGPKGELREEIPGVTGELGLAGYQLFNNPETARAESVGRRTAAKPKEDTGFTAKVAEIESILGPLTKEQKAKLAGLGPREVDPSIQQMGRNREEDRMAAAYRQETKDFADVQTAMATIEAAAKDATGAGDSAVIVAFNKFLDPQSVVRESEYARTAALGSLMQRMEKAVLDIAQGRKLEPGLKQEIVQTARKLYAGIRGRYEPVRKRYEKVAKGRGYNIEAVLGSFYGESTPGMGQATSAALPPGDYDYVDGKLVPRKTGKK